MQNKTKYLVTAALPYANNYSHIGHLVGAYLTSDIYVRYRKLNGDDVIFICGSDEYGTAIEMSAITENVSPKEIIDRYHFANKKAFEDMGIEFDIFSRTSSEIHHKTAQEFFLNLYNKKILYLKSEKQLFSNKENRFLADRFITGTCPVCGYDEARGDECPNCGSNLSPLELVNPKSKITGDTPVVKEAVHFYFPLEKFQDKISDWLLPKKNWKQTVMNYAKGWLKAGLHDRAISRDLEWGVKIPLNDYEGKVIYVWFEALIGYISMTKELFLQKNEPDKWKDYWFDENTKLINFLGKDNIVFHSIIFPAMLMAHGDFILPDNIPGNEFLNIKGEKLSKSKNNGILIKDIVKLFNPDVIRYTLTSILPENKDSEFDWKELQIKNNSELAAILGNFINRTIVFAKNKFEGKIPTDAKPDKRDEEILNYLKSQSMVISGFIESFKFRDALFEAMNAVRAANKYFNDNEPWKLVRDDFDRCCSVLNTCLQVCHSIAILFSPFIPSAADKILKILNKDKSNFNWKSIGGRVLKPGSVIGENEILFPQIEDKQIEELYVAEGNNETEKSECELNLISIDDFKKVNLKVAKIIECEIVPKSKKLLKLKLRVGKTEKQIVSGISEHYKPEDLIGKLIVIVDNLKPSKLMGIDSEGMLLAAKSNGELKIITIDGEIGEGAEVS